MIDLMWGAELLGFWFITMSAVQEVKLTLTELQNETDILLLQMLLLNKQTGIHLKYERNCCVILMHMLQLYVQPRFLNLLHHMRYVSSIDH